MYPLKGTEVLALRAIIAAERGSWLVISGGQAPASPRLAFVWQQQ